MVGIDGFAGPSDLVVVLTVGADPVVLAADLAAQAEHGAGSLVVAVSDDPALLDALGGDRRRGARRSPDAALAFADAFAPEHLQLAGAAAEALALRVRHAGCLFVGVDSGTAFGEFVAGSNHMLPTGGAAASPPGSRSATSAAAWPRCGSAPPRRRARARRRPARAGRGVPAARRVDGDAGESAGMTPRSARIERRTGETNVSLTVGLASTGAGTRATGVGFLDHMLDLVARHGRLDLDVEVTGDLQTGSHHTVEDTGGIVLGQALDQALADRRGIVRYGYAVIPMDEARAACAIDVSGRPLCATAGFERLPPGDIAGFEHEAAEYPRRRLGGEADAARRDPGRHQRPPHDRGVLQGLRPRAAHGGRRGPARAGSRPRRARSREPHRDRRLRDGQPAQRREGARARRRPLGRDRRARDAARPTA